MILTSSLRKSPPSSLPYSSWKLAWYEVIMAENNEIDRSAYVTWFHGKKRCNVGFALTEAGDHELGSTLGRSMSWEPRMWRGMISTIQCYIKGHQEDDGTLTFVLKSMGANPTLVRIP